MGQYDRHVFVCTSGETCPSQGDTERFVKVLRDGARQANRQVEVRVNKAGCFSQCGHGPMLVVYPEIGLLHAGCALTCLEHMWQFDLRTGAPMGDAQEGLKAYPLKEEQGQLYVAL